MYLYKKQYAENLGVLKDFSDKFSIESSSVNESNLTNEYEILEENFNEEEIEVQPVKVKLVKRLQQVKSRPRKKRKMN